MLALLEHAVEEKYAFAHNTLGKELFQEAEEWFFTANNESLYSFENICEYSLINSNYLPTALRRKTAQRKGPSWSISRQL